MSTLHVVALGQIDCILSLLWIGDVKGCKVPLLFAFPFGIGASAD